MAEILPFRPLPRVQPVISIHPNGSSYLVSVRPCPEGLPTLWNFAAYEEALNQALFLQNRYGFEIDMPNSKGAA